MQIPWQKKLFYFFPVLFCFCLPFGSLLLSGIIILWTLISLLNIDTTYIGTGFRNRNLWKLYCFFFLTLASSFLSSNKAEALFSIEVKLSFILFPYLLFCFKWPLPILKRCIVSFVSGCFFACLYLIVRAFLFSVQGQPEYFFYSAFSEFMHTSYFSMYLILAIAFVLVLYPRWFSSHRSVIYSSYFFVVIFAASIFLCASKLGIISFFVCGVLLLMYKWKLAIDLRRMVLMLASATLLCLVLVFFFPRALDRMGSLLSFDIETIDKTTSESTTVRVLIWKESLKLINDNFIMGTGVGDANDELYLAYYAGGLEGAYNLKLNAHNQFLQTFIGMGIAGFLLLSLITFGEAVRAVIRRNFLLFFFSLLVTLNFLVESMLQRAAGVLFFVFFYCLLHLVREKELTEDDVMF
jgi:O-antigen ligase